MIPKERLIEAGMKVRHDGGLLYRVEDVRQSTEDYERTHTLGQRVVNYTQLEAGEYPAGTPWSKSEEGFRENFTAVETIEGPDDTKERELEELQGQIELSEDDVKTLEEFAEKVRNDIRYGIIDVKCYAWFLEDNQLADRLAELEWDTDPLLNKPLTVFPVTETFDGWDDFSIPPTVDGIPLDDSFYVRLFNSETGKMFCFGFGPELEENDERTQESDSFQYSFGFVASYKQAGVQDIKILKIPSDSNVAIDDIRKALFEELNQA